MKEKAQKLSPIQVHLLRFFSERTINDQETEDLQQLIADFYSKKADNLMKKLWVKKGFTEATMLEILENDLKK